MRYLVVLSAFGLLAAPLLADWPHPVKWDQLQPDPNGYGAASWVNVADTGGTCTSADDFYCTGALQDRFITDIEFYGFSTYGSQYINTFRVQFWTDVPGTPNEVSKPGTLLYSYDALKASPTDPLKIGWQELETNTHFKIDLPRDHWFDQGLTPRVLWISLQGVMADDGYSDSFYWSFRQYSLHWNDDAAFDGGTAFPSYPAWWHWGISGGPDVYDNLLPTNWTTVDMCYRLTGIPEPASLLIIGLGAAFGRRR